ncbi:hypothetical protein ES703_122239 [subsurface metagenome]
MVLFISLKLPSSILIPYNPKVVASLFLISIIQFLTVLKSVNNAGSAAESFSEKITSSSVVSAAVNDIVKPSTVQPE